MTDSVASLRQQLLQLRELHTSGVLTQTQYDDSRAPLEKHLVDQVLKEAPAPAPAPGAAARPTPAAAPPAARAPIGLLAGLVAVAVAVAAGGYVWTRSGTSNAAPDGFAADGSTGSAAAPASAPHALGNEQMATMVDALATRLKGSPNDAEGWSMLGRSYMTLGRYPEALAAYETAMKLRPNDATVLADYADALAVKNNRSLDGEPSKLIDKALKLEPDNLKALVLAGTAAFNRNDFATAVSHWDHAIKVGPAESSMVTQARSGAEEARQRGKLPGAAPAAPAAETPATLAAVAGASVTGTVSLAPALAGKVAPEDTVFIFARAAEGSRMPLAILRKQVKDLPTSFQLDDSMAMSPAARLSGAGAIVVGARVSKSGQAMPQPGDYEGLTSPVAVGSTGLSITIANPSK
jgi:cytochrome c-type biogenesis protein CcmH